MAKDPLKKIEDTLVRLENLVQGLHARLDSMETTIESMSSDMAMLGLTETEIPPPPDLDDALSRFLAKKKDD